LGDKVAYKIESTRPEKISRLTLEYYNQCAEEFWEGTRHHDVSQNVEGHRHVNGIGGVGG
jgi:hypothetical protein